MPTPSPRARSLSRVVLSFSAVALLAIAMPAATPGSQARSATPWIDKADLFTAGAEGYALYRIPGLLVTPKGSLLAFCDARKTPALGDWSQIDIFMRRSTDGGKNWAPQTRVIHLGLHAAQGINFQPNPAAVAKGLGASGQMPINNQLPIADRDTGEVHLLHCVNYARCFYQVSKDDGVTFSPPVEITATFEEFKKDYAWKVIATGPNHGIQLKNGRLVVPVWLSSGGGEHGHRPSVVSTIYSDDHGKTWKRGQIAATETDPLINPNETVAVELTDGSVMLNMRSESLQHRRAISYSPDGATQWTRPEFVNDLYEPVCMAAIERVSLGSKTRRSRLVFSNPHNATESIPNHPSRFFVRKNVSVKISYDEGRSWPVNKTLESGPSGYSDLAVLPDGTICCLYERGSVGTNTQNAALTLARFNVAWVTDGKDRLED